MIMFIFLSLVLFGFSGKVRDYSVEKSTTIHMSNELIDINEGANPMIFVDSNKVGLLTFDLDKDFRAHELMRAWIELDVHKFYGEEKISICFLNSDYVQGTNSFYGTKEQHMDLNYIPDGATYSTKDGIIAWDFYHELVCVKSVTEYIPHHKIGKISIDVTKVVEHFSMDYTDEYQSPGLITFAFVMDSGLSSMKFDANSAIAYVETLDKTELFSDMFISDVPEFYVYMEQGDLDFINNDPVLEEYALCDVMFDGYMYTRAGCRYKGGVSTLNTCCFRDGPLNEERCRKLSFKIDTYEFRRDINPDTGELYYPKSEGKRKIYNQKKINFLAMEPVVKLPYYSLDGSDIPPWIQDYDQVAINVGIALIQLSDVQMALGKYAKLYMNDEYWGLYSMVEQTDDKFTEDRYWYDDNEGEGQLWKEFLPLNPDHAVLLENLKEGDEDMTWMSNLITDLEFLDPATIEARDYVKANFNLDNLFRMLAYTDIVGNFDGIHYMKCTGVGGCPRDQFKMSNSYVYRREINGVSNLEIIAHDLDNIGAGWFHLLVRTWYDEDFDFDTVCATGELSKIIEGPPVDLWGLPAQCTTLFRTLKLHFMDEYKKTFYYLVNNVLTKEVISDLVGKFSSAIKRTIRDEPTGVPTQDQWEIAVDYLEERLHILRQRAIDRTDLL